MMLVVLSWCVKRRGPLFASVFNPLMLVVVAVLSSLLLAEKLHLGSVLGAVLVVMGLYAVLWGKGRETASEAAKVGELPDDQEPIDVVVQRPPSSCAQQQAAEAPPRDSATTTGAQSEELARPKQQEHRSTR